MSNTAANYSVQQIKFEFLSYIKEFGSNGGDWFIGMANTLPDRMSGSAADGPIVEVIWICKPALSERAAEIVRDHMTSRHGVRIAPEEAAKKGNWVYMYRREQVEMIVPSREVEKYDNL